MGFYVEVMCNERKGWSAENKAKGPIRNRCFTDRSDNPQGPDRKTALAAAREQGWKVRGRYACCPNCLNEPTLKNGADDA